MNHNDDRAQIFYAHSAARHRHLCPRQVLGVRMGMLAALQLQLELPQCDKRLLTMVETDGCFADGIAVSTGCELGRRTLRLIDYGKIAATFIDTNTKHAIRIVPHLHSREYAQALCLTVPSRWHRYLEAYQKLPNDDLFLVVPVTLSFSLDKLIGEAQAKVLCCGCGEEIINGREIVRNGEPFCHACVEEAYYANISNASRMNGRLNANHK